MNCSPAPCVLPNVDASQGPKPANETPVAVDGRNLKHILTGANDYNCSNAVGFYASSDGGSNWTRTCMSVLTGMVGLGDPAVAYDLNGTAFAAGIEAPPNSTNGIVAFQTSTTNGKTWSKPRQAVPNVLGGLADKDWLEIDKTPTSPFANSLYISVTQFDSSISNTQISVSHSNDSGKSWKTVLVDHEQIYPKIDQSTDLAIGVDGTVYLTWMRCVANGPANDCGGTRVSMMISKSTDGGKTWSHPSAFAHAVLGPPCTNGFYGCLPNTKTRLDQIPVVAADTSSGSHSGNLYVVYNTWTGSYMKLMMATSVDGGKTWTHKRVTPASDTHDQFFPWVNVSADGQVGVSWLDRRNDPNNVDYEAFAAFSRNGGATFGKNIDLSANPSDPRNDGLHGSFMGDYSGNSWAGDKRFYVSYTDTTTGVGQDFLAGYQQ